MAGTQYLPRAVGIRRAKEIILTGKPFSAEQALQWGLVNELCESEALLDVVRAAGQQIADNGPVAVRGALRAINNAGFASLKEDYEVELTSYNETVPTQDRREGIAAFNEKRKAKFTGH
jgi:enoyl-CoA hydratase/carnithine racemase